MINKKLNLSPKIFKRDIEMKATRDGFGEGLVEAGRNNEKVVGLSADLSDSVRVSLFKKEFPERYIEVGVAEQALVTIASGMAAYGKIPFAASYAIFSPGRNWEQIRTTIAFNNVPVKIVGGHAGITVGPDGATHQALEDIALMRVLPRMVVLSLSDAVESKKAVLAAMDNGKPTYLRLSRTDSPVFTTEKTPFEIGKAEIYWESRDPKVAIIATGPLLYEALNAARKLSKSKINSLVINCHTIKPMDEQAIIKAAKIAGAIVTVEDHQMTGGLGSAIAEVLAKNFPVPMEFVGVNDQYGESGNPRELIKKFGLTSEDIISASKRVIRRKNN
ncbi:MAG: Transketolase, central region [Candidatus Woesebacteria bacterium GW2011_GWB1_43_14]|uniref:Transketolase, central region n=1 Tax=Candidatus Woesebacteria bacterium GW2011_GWB1_43_14 TaxID=1618578 RepID=A0A0G1DMN2_9BACT|nr:MAG: Transketolase, central region [Candidatus Woesebacteria bacterium GW2011_GWC1_42_9]KKS98909.1 MAG: Transketolase, central region [Candidatus Woesebacteria bacterium GW2011_GWB1_43_14]